MILLVFRGPGEGGTARARSRLAVLLDAFSVPLSSPLDGTYHRQDPRSHGLRELRPRLHDLREAPVQHLRRPCWGICWGRLRRCRNLLLLRRFARRAAVS
jgi:hypothetical protein